MYHHETAKSRRVRRMRPNVPIDRKDRFPSGAVTATTMPRRRRHRRPHAAVAFDWLPLRARFVALFDASGRTQADVARLGGLSSQAAVSKILHGSHCPTVEQFIRAVNGLGVSLSEFFAPWTHAGAVTVPPTLSAEAIVQIADAVAARVLSQKVDGGGAIVADVLAAHHATRVTILTPEANEMSRDPRGRMRALLDAAHDTPVVEADTIGNVPTCQLFLAPLEVTE